jgi:predicted DNA-binding protein (MmcQ/YjbR family)
MPSEMAKLKIELRKFALAFPGAREDFPWGERVAKVGKKVFVFLGRDGGDTAGISVKLPVSGAIALTLPFAEPTGYGLGKSGWVSLTFSRDERPPLELLCEWIEESYRAVAPKKLIGQIGAPTASAKPRVPSRPRRRKMSS